MGKEVEKQASERGHEIVERFDTPKEWNTEALKKADVVIDFSLPDSAIENIYKCFDAGIPIVTGTTGWYDKLGEVSEKCKSSDQTLFYAPNFSVGVNLFFEINQALSKLMNEQEMYEAEISETHHIHKKDAPSGTAKQLANILIGNLDKYNAWSAEPASNEQLRVESFREDEVPGTHAVSFDSDIDKITLTHEAKSRIGFALGAVKAAEWVPGKKGVFTMKDFLFNNF
jgi:4-hydroxy-tetrahydrodipicolinate reductase